MKIFAFLFLARREFEAGRVKVSISVCDEWSFLPKAKSLVWALQDEFEDQKEQTGFQLLLILLFTLVK